jgi:hypothetical protein
MDGILHQPYSEENLEKGIPRLYPDEKHKVTIHMDSASRHVCSEMTDWIKSRGVKFFLEARMDEQQSGLLFSELGINLIFKNPLSEKSVHFGWCE